MRPFLLAVLLLHRLMAADDALLVTPTDVRMYGSLHLVVCCAEGVLVVDADIGMVDRRTEVPVRSGRWYRPVTLADLREGLLPAGPVPPRPEERLVQPVSGVLAIEPRQPETGGAHDGNTAPVWIEVHAVVAGSGPLALPRLRGELGLAPPP